MTLASAWQRFGRRTGILALAAALLATLCAEGLYRSGYTDRLEFPYVDLWHRLAGHRVVPKYAALVMVDDPSLNARPDEPLPFWTPHFATALATLKAVKARGIAIDFIFSGSPESWIGKLGLMAGEASRDYDRPFREQINGGGVTLSAYRIGTGKSADDYVLPSPDYLLALPDMDMAANIGLANLRDDSDGTVRRFGVADAKTPYAEKEGMPFLPFAALAAIRASGQDPRANGFAFGSRKLPLQSFLPIAFAGPPGTFHPISFETLLRPDAASLPEVRALEGKVVVIGAGYAGMNDIHPTPYSTGLGSTNRLMDGAEIQANIVETLMSGRFVDAVPDPVRLAIYGLTFGALAFIGAQLSPWLAVALVAAAATAGGIMGYWFFLHDVVFPTGHLHLGMAIVLSGLMLLRLTREERERARIGTLFGRYVSSQVVAAMLASPELPELGGEARQVTVLFSDIRNFTSISEKLSAKEVVEMLNTYFERVCTALLAEGASIDKFIGDAVMAEFGTPLPQPDHALRALRAAVALRQTAVDFRAWMASRFAGRELPEFNIGIGVHTGEAVVGNIGSQARMEYTAIGDTVNIASRLESMTKPTGCTILASEATVTAAGPKAHAGARHSLMVKGRVQAVDAVEILAVDGA